MLASAPPSQFVSLCGSLAPITSVILTLSPLPTLLSIRRQDGSSDALLPSSSSSTSDASIASLPLLPYSALTVNATLWTLYGLLLNSFTLYSCNGVGIFLGVLYLAMFYRKSSLANGRKLQNSLWTRRDLPFTAHVHVVAMLSLLSLGTTLYMKAAKEMLALTATIVCLVMFYSPLSKLSNILKNKHCPPGAIPLPFTAATAANCFFWSIYGVKGAKDAAIAVPNIFGLACA